MKISGKNQIAFIVLATAISFINCNGSNPIIDLNVPSTLIGNYDLVSLTLKSEFILGNEIKIIADQPTEVTFQINSATRSFIFKYSGAFSLTESQYTMSITNETSEPGQSGSETEELMDTGSYALDGTTMTFTRDNDEHFSDFENATAFARNSLLTLNFPDATLLFKKQ